MATWDFSTTKHHLLLCNGSSCNKSGAEEVTLAIRNEISDKGLDDVIHTTRTKCNGRCEDKCVVVAYPQGIWYKDLLPEDAPKLITSLLEGIDFTKKISHTFQGDGFYRESGIPEGKKKEKEHVKKVSKTFK